MAPRPRILLLAIALLAALLLVPTAFARGGNVRFDGGTTAERTQVTRSLATSSFDWGLLPGRIVVHIAPDLDSTAAPGEVWLDARLLDSGPFSWGVVQHEFAHQVDFLLLTPATRAQLLLRVGGSVWCVGGVDLPHGDYGCERFASTLAWAYWPNGGNCMRPVSSIDEAAAMNAPAFRLLLATVLKTPSLENLRRR
jgi:hypothetical protein